MRPKRFFTGFFFTSFAAVCMVMQTVMLIHQHAKLAIYLFVFSLVFIGYQFYFLASVLQSHKMKFSIIRKPQYRWRILHFVFVFPVFLYAISIIQIRIELWLLLGFFFLTYLFLRSSNYSANSKSFGWLKTIWLSIIWTYVTFKMPLGFLNIPVDKTVDLMMLQRFCFIFLIALFFDLRDVEKDRYDQKKSLATQIGKIGLFCTLVVLVASSITVALFLFSSGSISAFSTLILITSTLIAGMLNHHHEKIKNRLHYLILGDGCMILSTGLLFVERISLLCWI